MKANSKVTRNNRKDFEYNQREIQKAFIALVKENKGRRPTRAELAERTGLNLYTVQRHLRGVDFKDLLAEDQKSFRLLTDDIVFAIYRSAMKGNPSAQKLWLNFVEGWSEKTEMKHSGGVKVDQSITIGTHTAFPVVEITRAGEVKIEKYKLGDRTLKFIE